VNHLTRHILSELLKDPQAWQITRRGGITTGYKPKLSYIYEQIRVAREILFYDDVYYPHLSRFMEIVKRWNLFPEVKQ